MVVESTGYESASMSWWLALWTEEKKSLYHGKKYLWKITGSDLKQSTCWLTYLGNHYSYGLRKERFLAFKNMNWYLRTWLLSRSFLPCEKHNCCEYNIPTVRRKIKHYCTYLKTGVNVDLPQKKKKVAVFELCWINSEPLTIQCKTGISEHSVIQQFVLAFPLVIGLI